MKRKASLRKPEKKEESENHLDEGQENGDKEQPLEKKNKRSISKATSETESSDEDKYDSAQAHKNKKTPARGRKSKAKSDSEESEFADPDEYDSAQANKNKRSPTKGRKSRAKSDSEESDIDDLPTEEKMGKKNKSKSKTSKASSNTEESEHDDEQSIEEADPLAGDEAQYEVEAILDKKNIRGVKHFLIRWKGYTEESDTWEPEDTLNCSDLIKEFKETRPEKKEGKKDKKSKAGGDENGDVEDGSPKPGKKKAIKHKKNKAEKNIEMEEWDENEDFEVERIVDVYFHKNGKRDFLVHWKGYPTSQESWEPEDNMDCKDLIKKFMEKVEEARKYEGKELRVNRKPVQRLDFAMHQTSRKLSKRNRTKERVHYYDQE